MGLEVLFKIGLNNGKKRMQVPSGYEYLATTKSTGSRESKPSRCHISEHYLRCSLQYLRVLQQIFIIYIITIIALFIWRIRSCYSLLSVACKGGCRGCCVLRLEAKVWVAGSQPSESELDTSCC